MPRPYPPEAVKSTARFFKRPRRSLGIAGVLVGAGVLVAFLPKFASANFTYPKAPATASTAGTLTYADFKKTVEPFLDAHCYDCHGESDTEGGVRLDLIHDDASLAKNVPTLAKALKMLAARKMPPKDKPHPTEDEYRPIVAWIGDYTNQYYMTGPVDPGRVTLHRLNRAEYDNTIRDLLGLKDFHPADTFPSDDGGYGFDNNGDVLSIAPVLFEKYIKAAELSLNTAVFTDPLPAPTKSWDATTLAGDIPPTSPAPVAAAANPNSGAAALADAVANNAAANAGGAVAPANGAAAAGARGRGAAAPPVILGRIFQYAGYIYVNYDFPVEGDYILSFKGYMSGGPAPAGRAAGGAAAPYANALFFLDGDKPVGSDARPLKVVARANMPADYATAPVHITAGVHQISLAFRSGASLDEYKTALAAQAAAAAAPAPAADSATAAPATVATTAVAAAPVVVAAADPTVTSNGSDPAAAPATPAAGGAQGARFGGQGAAAGAAGNRRGRGGFAGPTSVTGKVIMGVLSFKVEGPAFVNAATMPDRMPESYHKVISVQPSATLSRSAAAEKIIRDFTTRAYRRPATDEEVKSLMALWTSVDAPDRPFEKSVTVALQAVLLNPDFLFRVEADPQAGEANNIHTLNEYELASRLSYFLWSSMPDDELFKLAGEGKLRANLDQQVERMLKDPKAGALVENFAGQWLHLRKVDDVNPDADRFKDFSPELKPAMLKETQLFFTSIMNEDRSVLDFIDANYSFVNAPLAKLYGLDGNFTDDNFQRVTFPADSQRGGLVTQASILAITSYNNRTSPVQRGKWVLENLLDDAPPPPPPNVPALGEDKKDELSGTLKERMEQHRANPVCASCHERMDAIGFSLENFDPAGGWRTKDTNDDPIDASGSFPDGTKFVGAQQLKQTLMAEKDKFCLCLASKMLSYAIGRNVEPSDKRALNDITTTMQKNGEKFSALIHAVVHSDAFQQRRGNQPGDKS